MQTNAHTKQNLRKVLGEKVYGYDFYPTTLGWGDTYRHAVIIRSDFVGSNVQAIDTTVCPERFSPSHIVDSKYFTEQKISLNAGWTGNPLFCSFGNAPEYIGQPIAIAYFENSHKCRSFKHWIRQDGNSKKFIKRENRTTILAEQDIRAILSPVCSESWRNYDSLYGKPSHFIRVAGESPSDPDRFSYINNGYHDPFLHDPDSSDFSARDAYNEVSNQVAHKDSISVHLGFSSSTNDTMFMELESGCGWWKPEVREIHIVVGTQSPEKDRSTIISIFRGAASNCKVNLIATPPGGGFGGRDISSFPILLALAAYGEKDGYPVRLAYDRFEQFQVGIKRHAFAAEAILTVDRKSNQISAFKTRMAFNGGGTPNLTEAVVGLAAIQSAGPYIIPKVAISSYGYKTAGATAGSMRGFGIPQATFVIESLVDAIANQIKEDPIAFRISQIVEPGDRDCSGYSIIHPVATKTLCEIASKEVLWTRREEERTSRSTDTFAYGVGFACCMESYGTSSDAVFAAVELHPTGPIVFSSAVDMGQGSSESLCQSVKEHLGRDAIDAHLGLDSFFDSLDLVYEAKDDVPEEKRARKRANGASASMTAFHHMHAMREAANILLIKTIRAAACSLVKNDEVDLTWTPAGTLTCTTSSATKEIEWKDLYDQALKMNTPLGAMVHTFFQESFAVGTFRFNNNTFVGEFDGLSLKFDNAYLPVERVAVNYPKFVGAAPRRTLYAGAAHIISVIVNRRTGNVKIDEIVSLLDPGEIINRSLLEGQVEGGAAMGIGMALKESLPIPLDGVSSDWNLDRYHVPRVEDVPTAKSHKFIFAPHTSTSGSPVRHKGIAEATMSTVPAAIANAIFHATGRRYTALPITKESVLSSLSH